MKVITLHHPHSFNKDDFPQMVLALGFFDGVHRGHQEVIQSAKNVALEKKLKMGVMTFDPHPSVVLSKTSKQVKYITPLDDKIARMKTLGVDYLFIVRFTSKFASLEPQAFIDQYIIGLNVKHVTAGFDYTYGKKGKGTMETLPDHSRGQFSYHTVGKLAENNKKISSTYIRKSLREGQLTEVTNLLGRFYTTKGTVIQGEKRGRKIGFPTANIQLNADYIIPKTGVYAVRIFVNNSWYHGVCNVGYKPTFKHPDEYTLSIEVHIFDFHASIYGEEVEIEWHQRIRDEKKFNGVEALIKQISADKDIAAQYFAQL